MHLRRGGDGTVYHHLISTGRSKKWKEKRKREERKRQNGANCNLEVEREQRNIRTERETVRGETGGRGGGKREVKRWERRRERQIERTGREVFYPSSPGSKTLISSIDSWLFRSLAVKCSLHTCMDTHSVALLHTHSTFLSFTHTHRGYKVAYSLPSHNTEISAP